MMDDLIAIVPAKTSSTRVPDKNYRPFYGGWSLVDITLRRLKAAGLPADRIYLSCEDIGKRHVAEAHGVNFLLRPPELCGNDVPVTDWIRAVTAQVPGDSDVVWSQVCDPLFRSHRDCLDLWPVVKRDGHDSLTVRYPQPGYHLDPLGRPIGWGWGEWHVPSQRLPAVYLFPFTLSILTRASIARCGYHIGARAYWFDAPPPFVDIDTMDDFVLAQAIYARQSVPDPST